VRLFMIAGLGGGCTRWADWLALALLLMLGARTGRLPGAAGGRHSRPSNIPFLRSGGAGSYHGVFGFNVMSGETIDWHQLVVAVKSC